MGTVSEHDIEKATSMRPESVRACHYRGGLREAGIGYQGKDKSAKDRIFGGIKIKIWGFLGSETFTLS